MKHEPAEFDVIQYIRENFIYHENGTFTRKDRRNSCGSLDKDGYLIIKIKKKQYKAHRLVFAYHNGRFPDGELTISIEIERTTVLRICGSAPEPRMFGT